MWTLVHFDEIEIQLPSKRMTNFKSIVSNIYHCVKSVRIRSYSVCVCVYILAL